MVTLTAAVIVRGATDDPADTVIKNGFKTQMFSLSNAGAELRNLTLHSGQAGTGGGVLIPGGGRVINCIITACQSTSYNTTSAISCTSAAGVVSNCVFYANRASLGNRSGQTVYLSAGKIANCVFFANEICNSDQNNSAHLRLAGSAVAENCVIRDSLPPNCSTYLPTSFSFGGGAVYLAGNAVMRNCTIVRNRGLKGGGVFIDSNSAHVYDCIILGNQAGYAPAAYMGTMKNYHGCVADMENPTGDNCTFLENLEAAGFVAPEANDFRLSSSSAALGKGAFPEAATEVAIIATSVLGTAPLSAAFSSTLPGTCEWTINDVPAAETSETFSTTFENPGVYTLSLTVDGAKSAVRTVRVVPAEMRVDPADINAFASLYDAIEAAAGADGVTIFVANGTYTFTKTCEIFSGIKVIGESRDGTIFKKGSANHRLFRLEHPDATLCNMTISGGLSQGNPDIGGNVWLGVFGGSLYDCTITGGKTASYGSRGGNLFIHAPSSVVSNCIIRNGLAPNGSYSGFGGGIAMFAGLVTHCVISNNAASNAMSEKDGGSGILLQGGTVANCLIAKNIYVRNQSNRYPSADGGVNISGGSLINCTIVGNKGYGVGGVYASGGSVSNCIIIGNLTDGQTDAQLAAWGPAGASSRFSNCLCDYEIVGGANCFVASDSTAGFVDYVNGDYRMAVGGAAIDRGATEVNSAAIDLDGAPRVAGNAIDIGCYEYTPSSEPLVSFATENATGIAPFETTLAANYEGFSAAPTLTWTLTPKVGGEPIVFENGDVEHTITIENPGIYDVKLTAESGDQYAEYFAADFLTVFGANIFVVPPTVGGSTPTFPYATWETAATDFVDAINNAIDGTTVWLSNGTYHITSPITIFNATTVRSISGTDPSEVTIYRNTNDSKFRPISLNNAGAKVMGVTIRGGYSLSESFSGDAGGNVLLGNLGGSLYNCQLLGGRTASYGSQGGGLFIVSANSVVSNCVIAGNRAPDGSYNPYGGGVYMANGLLTHCIITNNTLVRSEAEDCGGSGIFMRGGRAENCLVANNISEKYYAGHKQGDSGVHIRGGTLANCTIVGNSAFGVAGVYSAGGEVVNCIIAGNISDRFCTVPEPESSNVHGGYNSAAFSYCAADCAITQGGVLREGCFVTDFAGLRFKNSEAADFRLRAGSSAYNAGTPLAADFSAATDLAGKPRVLFGKIDIGCYECPSAPPTLMMLR